MGKKFIIQIKEMNVGDSINVSNKEYNHIVKVLRHKEKDNIIVCNGEGKDYLCQIANIFNDYLVLTCEKVIENSNNCDYSITVCQASLKGDKNQFVCEKCTELGVNSLLIFNSKNVVAKFSIDKIAKLEKTSLEALKQCNRSSKMNIRYSDSIKNLSEYLRDFDIVLLAYENSNYALSKVMQNIKRSQKIALVIGAEGGFDKTEIEYLLQNTPNVFVASLGNAILRAETANLALTSIVMHKIGVID